MGAAAPDEGPKKYEFLIQGEVVRDEITVENTMKQVLYWIAFFWVSSSQQALIEDAFFPFNYVKMLT